MLPVAIRRAVFSGSSASVGVRAGLTVQQRRMSSSKPSSPNDAKSVTDIPASTSGRDSATKAGGEKRKKRVKDALDRDDVFRHLPSVPSTQHMSQEAIGLSTFFSLHRPISVTHSLPKPVTDEAFAAIFQPKSRAAKMSEVISTIQGTVDTIERPLAKLDIAPHNDLSDPAGHPRHDQATKIDVKHPDGRESSVFVQLENMSGKFLPFRPPPSPKAKLDVAEHEEAKHEEQVMEATEAPHRVYKATFTIEETTELDGNVRVVAHSPEIVNERVFGPSRRVMRRGGMLAISVKRQRKLKMKKKKYKKFMKRTRNLRRKLDRL